ncbi:nucleoid-associated protein SMXD51_07197 [Firmicutes bacterium CAG:884]|nr:nucleoid-associated protein SMXD51_07197 [Firmicutes bacterium CAG:884]
MNMQAMLRQAQKLQSEMMKEKKAIDETLFEGVSALVTVKAYGNRKIESVEIKDEAMEDKEMLQDMLLIAFNDLIEKIDKKTEEKMGKYTNGMSGLF